MNGSTLTLRFDIDTLECVSALPGLVALADASAVPLTFYANFGRSISYLGTVRTALSSSSGHGVRVSKLPVSAKFARARLFRTLFTNPALGAYAPNSWRVLQKSSHEVGLHGGRNHALWQAGASEWPEAKVRNEIQWGVQQYRSLMGRPPQGFASPGWNSPTALPFILRDMGFGYFADSYGAVQKVGERKLPNLHTNLLGMPGGVGIFEWAVASNMTVPAFLQWFSDAYAPGRHNMLYDHPGFTLLSAQPYLQALLDWCDQQGVVIVAAGDVARG